MNGVNNNNNVQRDIEEDVKTIREWLEKQPHLPPKIDDMIIRKFLNCTHQSLEKTKSLIDLNYTLRSQAPDIFDDRDPTSTAMKSMFNTIDLCPLPKLNEKKQKLFIYRIGDADPEKFIFADSLKMFFMVADVRVITDTEDSQGEIPMFDMQGFTLRHLTKITLPLVKKYMVYTQEAHSVRLRQIHVLNTTPFLDKCLALVRPFMKAEVSKLLHFHTPNSTTLFDHISRDLIPAEYGGTLNVTMDSIKADYGRKLLAHREFFMDADRWRVNETLRAGQNRGELFGMQGSFRTLSID